MEESTDDTLWQGVNGINNPCPLGYRLPIAVEFQELVSTSSITNGSTAYILPMKFVLTGYRFNDAGLNGHGVSGYYWTSTVVTTSASKRYFNTAVAGAGSDRRACGFAVRCIKD